MNYSVLV